MTNGKIEIGKEVGCLDVIIMLAAILYIIITNQKGCLHDDR